MLSTQNPAPSQESEKPVTKDSKTVISDAPPPYEAHHRTERGGSRFVAQKSASSQGLEHPVNSGSFAVTSKAPPPPYSFFQWTHSPAATADVARAMFTLLRSQQPHRGEFTRESFGSLGAVESKNQAERSASLSGDALPKASK